MLNSSAQQQRSVPCMFSQKGRIHLRIKKQGQTTKDNVLDILNRAGISLLWKKTMVVNKKNGR